MINEKLTIELQNQILNIEETLKKIRGKIVWTNSSPTSAFAAQTITLDESIDNYDMYEIIFAQSITNPREFTTGKIPIGHGTILGYLVGGLWYFRATGETVSGSTMSFEDSKQSNANTTIVDNSRVIPLYVIGYNTGLFS